MLMPTLLDNLEQIKEDAKRGPLHRSQFQMPKIFAREGFPGAGELMLVVVSFE